MAGGVPFNRSLIISVLVVLVLRVCPIACDTQGLIASVCQSTGDQGFCTSVFNQNLKSPDTDLKGLAEIALEQGINNASGTAQYAKDLYDQTRDLKLQEYLETCSSKGYLATLGSLREGQEDLRSSSYDGMANVLFIVPPTQANYCDGQPTISGAPNPLNERNREMRILISMGVSTALKLAGRIPPV